MRVQRFDEGAKAARKLLRRGPMMGNSNTQEFLNLFRELEMLIRRKHDLGGDTSAVAWLIKNQQSRYGNISAELNYCREVRNLLSHNPKLKEGYLVEPSDAMLETLRSTILRIEKPPLALNAGIRIEKVFWREMGDRVRPAMIEMAAKGYTHVPILDDGRVVGVFSENTLLSCLIAEEIFEISDDSRFSDIGDLLLLEAHASESFRFISKLATVGDAALLFSNAQRRTDRIGMMFVTADGRPSQRILGIVTPWDLSAYL